MKSTRYGCVSPESPCCRKEKTVPFTVDHSDSIVRRVSYSAMVNPEVTNMCLVAREQGMRETNRMFCCSRANRQTGQS